MKEQGLSLPELVVTLAVLALLASLGCQSGSEALARQRLESASRALSQGIERARNSALRKHAPCAMRISTNGWSTAGEGVLPTCLPDAIALQEGNVAVGDLRLTHNMPAELRFSSNGLVLDGGTVVLTMRGTNLRRCLVMALPLGVVRVGRYAADPNASPDSAACLPDPSL